MKLLTKVLMLLAAGVINFVDYLALGLGSKVTRIRSRKVGTLRYSTIADLIFRYWYRLRLPYPVPAGGADPYVDAAVGLFTGTVGSTALVAGDLVYFDGTDWEKADADDNTKYAEAIAVNSVASGAVGAFCTSCLIVDIDAPFTQGSTYYLSTTAGGNTATRPTGANNLMQVVGFGLSTSILRVDIRPPREITISMQFPYTTHAAPQDRDNDFAGLGLDDTSAEVHCGFMVPQNCVSTSALIAYLWWCGTGTVLDTGDTYTIDASAGIDDETTSATADGIAAASLAVAANDLANADVSACFDASGIIEPGNYVGVAIKKDAEGSTGDDPIMLGLEVVLLVV
jgi:hypothetical protein